MFDRHTYFIIVCLAILLITLTIGTFFLKEGYDDYLNALLMARGYDKPAAQGPGSSGYALQAKYTCPDGTNRLDHIDVDCSKPLRVVSVAVPGVPESCTVSKNTSGETVDSCKSISSFLFCDTTTNKCNTLTTKELAPGQACKYDNECLSQKCIDSKCSSLNTTPTASTSATALQTLGTNVGSGSQAGTTNIDNYFALLNKQNGSSSALDSYFQLQNLETPFVLSNTATQPTVTKSATTELINATTAPPSPPPPTSETPIPPSKNTTQMSVGTRGDDFYKKVKQLMADDIHAVIQKKKAETKAIESQACYDSCC